MLTTLKPGYYLGVDAGASRVEAVITTESGFVLGRGTARGANPHNAPIDFLYEGIREAIRLARNDAHMAHPEQTVLTFEAAGLGLAGYDAPTDRELLRTTLTSLPPHAQTLGAKRLVVVNDGLIGLKSGTDQSWGICISAGTGSSCYGLTPSGKEATAGGWGYMLGDQGSGYAIGRDILRQVMREYDGRSPKTELTTKVLETLGLESPTDLLAWAYRDHVPIPEISTLSRLCNDVNLSDSVELVEIIHRGVHELTLAYEAVIHRLNLGERSEPIPVILTGGLFSMQGQFSDKIIRSILNRTPQADIIFPTRSNAEGAVRLALLGTSMKFFPQSALFFINPHIS